MLGGKIDMKYKLSLILFVLLLSLSACEDNCVKKAPLNSVMEDIRCRRLKQRAVDIGVKAGFCVYTGTNHPDPEKCYALWDEAQKKCDELPPDPSSWRQVSGSAIYDKDGNLLSINGQGICP